MYVSIRKPGGGNLVAPGYVTAGTTGFIDTVALPDTGHYEVFVDPEMSCVGSTQVTLHDVPADATATASVGGPAVSVNAASAGQNGVVSFGGTAGQRVSIKATNITGTARGWSQFKLFSASGAVLANSVASPTGDAAYIDVVTLPTTGTYTAVFDPMAARTGSADIQVFGVQDLTGSIATDGTPVADTLDTPGQVVRRTFSATAGQKIGVRLTESLAGAIPPYSRYSMKLTGPSGQVGLITSRSNPNDWIEATLSSSGSYTIEVDPTYDYIGAVALQVHEVPADQSGTTAADGVSRTLTITSPGQNAAWTFAGATGETLTLTAANNSISPRLNLSVRRPNGTLQAGYFTPSGSGGSWSVGTLSTAGQYSLVADPVSYSTGSVDLTLEISGTAQATARTTTTRSRRPAQSQARLPESRRPASAQREVRPGQGVSAVEGRVRGVGGKALARVRVRIGRRIAMTNRRGVFRVKGLAPGPRTMLIDARRIGRGVYQYVTTVQPTRVTRLSAPVWLPRLDRRVLPIPARTGRRGFVVRARSISGLEIHLPPRSRVVDARGRTVRGLTITRIPIRKPPHPLPDPSSVPVYYTIQPGLARIVRLNGRPARARIVYPNYVKQPVGRRIGYLAYDARSGWRHIGYGTIVRRPYTYRAPARGGYRLPQRYRNTMIRPDRGVGITRFTGAMVYTSAPNPNNGPVHDGPYTGDPIDLQRGVSSRTDVDLSVADTMPIAFGHVNNAGDGHVRAFGENTSTAYDLRLAAAAGVYDTASLFMPDGRTLQFDRINSGTSLATGIFEHTSSPGAFYKARLYPMPNNGIYTQSGWEMSLTDGTRLQFQGPKLALTAIIDRFGSHVSVIRKSAQGLQAVDPVSLVRSPNGRWIAPTYNSSDWVTSARDNLGREVTYTYTSNRLTQVTNPGGGTYGYTYDGSGRLATVVDPRGNTVITNTYDLNGRVTTQANSLGANIQTAYTGALSGASATDVTDPAATVTHHEFDAQHQETQTTRAYGTAEARTTTYVRGGPGGNITRLTEPDGHHTDYTYDSSGNTTSVTVLAGTAEARTTTYTREPTYGQVTQTTNPDGTTQSVNLGPQGRIQSVTDAAGATTTVQTNPDGQPTQITDPTGRAIQIAYRNGDAVTSTDPSGATTRVFFDAAGRLRTVTDPEGSRTTTTYDALDRATTTADPLGRTVTYTYDPNGNLTAFTNQRGKTTTSTYNSDNQPLTTTDPLGHTTTTTYDTAGRVASVTDRRGKRHDVLYNTLGQVTRKGFDATGPRGSATYASQIDYTYDILGNLTQRYDSTSGPVNYTYDNLGRVTEEGTWDGTQTFTYDGSDNLTKVTAPGLPDTTYTHDPAGRLTQLSRGSQTASFSYDPAGRLLSTTNPTGVVTTNAYDPAGRLQSLTYTRQGATLGQVAYGYSPAGHPTERSGSWARLGIPQALPGGVFDDGDRLVSRGGTTLTYDNEGNLTNDGTNSYAWNPRGQLVGITGPGHTYGFAYDAAGRRNELTIDGTLTTFTHLGDTPLTETTGTTTSYLSAGTDNYLTQTTGTTTTGLLQDAQNSTIATTDNTGMVTTTSTYTPFGQATSTPSSPTRIGYTGAQTDPTGLTHMRARYYNPTTASFISQDPLGLTSLNSGPYNYADADPATYTDPTGLISFSDLGGFGRDIILDYVHPTLRDWAPGYGLAYSFGRGNRPTFDDVVNAVPVGAAPRFAAKPIRFATRGGGDSVSDFRRLRNITGGGSRPRLAADAEETGVASGKITGYTRHGLNQAISRDGHGVHPGTILDVVRNPTTVVTRNSQRGATTIYQNANGRVVLNEKGCVITCIGFNRGTWRY
ncbi:MAG: RHS repeat-associated core domain-containing protein [Thermoleophilia bacterium]